jgi:hypothetical protein
MILKPRRRDKKIECRGCKDHECKTLGSVLHGLVYAYECALLVSFCIHDTKKSWWTHWVPYAVLESMSL